MYEIYKHAGMILEIKPTNNFNDIFYKSNS
jgi:hypothetical protein